MAKIVAAAGTASGSVKSHGRNIEKAMTEAAAQAQKEGVTDPDKIRERMLAARKAVRQGARTGGV